MSATREQILAALGAVKVPGFTRDIVSFGAVQELTLQDGHVRLHLRLPSANPALSDRLEGEIRSALASLEGLRSVQVQVDGAAPPSGLHMVDDQPPATAPAGIDENLIPGVKRTIAVASGKGGVGKSTVAVNLAVALARRGLRVGLLDADIYGPSIPLMMGVDEKPKVDAEGRRLIPFDRHGVRFMSLGFLLERDLPVIWRGPMVMKAVEQLLRDVVWGNLDILVVDMPPGTGDAQLTLSQKVSLTGSLIVTTPQDVALADAIKGVAMFRKVGVPVLGIVENMSFFACPHCGEKTDIFGHGGGKTQAERLGVPFLGEIALDPILRATGDTGTPIVQADPESPPATSFLSVADRVLDMLGDGSESGGIEQPRP
jgi:ATP-binding protein involved in chromosome partitioning